LGIAAFPIGGPGAVAAIQDFVVRMLAVHAFRLRLARGAGLLHRCASTRAPAAAPSSLRRRREADALAAAASQLDPAFHQARAAICKPNGDVTVHVNLHSTRAAVDHDIVEQSVAEHLKVRVVAPCCSLPASAHISQSVHAPVLSWSPKRQPAS
jgi:hypothetical protein